MAEALRAVVEQWRKKIQLAWDHRKREFMDDAEECARFFDGPYDWLYRPRRDAASHGFDFGSNDLPGPSCRMTVNKTAELVQLFGPSLYHRNPVRKVNPRQVVELDPGMFGPMEDPNAMMMFQQAAMSVQQQQQSDRMRGDLMSRYLNYTPTALDLKTESRWAITEALVKGMGCLWSRLHRPPGAVMSWAGTFFDSVDNLLLDPDAENIRDIKWLARRRVRPVWEVERERGLPPGYLSGQASAESYSQISSYASDPAADYRRKQGQTSDLIVYWEVYSKMGMGGRLSGVAPEAAAAAEAAGDYCYLEICDHCQYPLNLPPPYCDYFGLPEAQGQPLPPAIQERVSWQTPYWADGEWPVTFLAFHWRPGKLWPMSHMKPGLGELKFLNWAWSFLASKVRTASRDFIVIAKAAGQELKNILTHGGDYSVIELEQLLGPIDNVVKWLQHPGFNPEIYNVIEGVAAMFDKRVGLTELIYGQSTKQLRSAQEAQNKQDAVSVRPDDMANCVEDAMTDVARKEAFCARWHLRGQDVAQVLGPVGADMWEGLVVPSDPAAILYSLEYRIEANSARKPNQALQQANMRDAMQQLFAPLFQYAQMTGSVSQVNALLSDWAKSVDLDPTPYLLMAPPPPPPPPGAGEGGPPPKGNA